MSTGTNGKTHTPTRADAMWTPRRDVDVEWDGERLHLIAGRDRLGGDHPLVAAAPEAFVPAPATTIGQRERDCRRGHGDGRTSRNPPMSLQRETAIRTARLHELKARAAAPHSAPSSEELFWHAVDRLLANPEQEAKDRKAMALIDRLNAGRARSLADERADLTTWLDKP